MNSLVRLLVLCGPIVALVAAVGLAHLTEASPPIEDDTALHVGTLALALVLQAFFIAFWRNSRTSFLERVGRGALLVLLPSMFVYGFVLLAFSVRLDADRDTRAPLGIVYTTDFRDYLQDHPEVTARSWVAGGDSPERVYTAGSLQLVKLLFASLWLVVAQSFLVFLTCTAIVLSRRIGWADPNLAILRERLELWPDAATRKMRATLEAAMLTLVENGNRRGAVLTVAPLFEGRDGFLGAVAAAAGTKLERSLWADQIEELRTAGHLPPHVASELHSIRVCSNDARHNQRRLIFDDVRRALEAAVRCEEWFLFEFPRGPLLPRPDATGSHSPAAK